MTPKLEGNQITDADIERDTEMGTLVVNYDKFAKETDECSCGGKEMERKLGHG